METVKQVLQQARAILERGWHHGNLTDHCGNVCMKAAVQIAAGECYMRQEDGAVVYTDTDDFFTTKLTQLSMETVARQLPEPFKSIPTYNDYCDTTKDDVLAVMDKAIASC